MTNRPKTSQRMMATALQWSEYSTCLRGKTGAVIWTPDGQILSVGFNGAPKKSAHCLDVGCLIVEGYCMRSVHAEANAIAFAAKNGVRIEGAFMSSLTRPCSRICAPLIVQAGISLVEFSRDYTSDGPDGYILALGMMHSAHVIVHQVPEAPEVREFTPVVGV